MTKGRDSMSSNPVPSSVFVAGAGLNPRPLRYEKCKP
jgi:hypothetical protein